MASRTRRHFRKVDCRESKCIARPYTKPRRLVRLSQDLRTLDYQLIAGAGVDQFYLDTRRR